MANTRSTPPLSLLTPDDLAELVAGWLTNYFEDDHRVKAVVGPVDDRVTLLVGGSKVLVVEVAAGEIVPR